MHNVCGRYHVDWCPGGWSRKGISRHGVDPVCGIGNYMTCFNQLDNSELMHSSRNAYKISIIIISKSDQIALLFSPAFPWSSCVVYVWRCGSCISQRPPSPPTPPPPPSPARRTPGTHGPSGRRGQQGGTETRRRWWWCIRWTVMRSTGPLCLRTGSGWVDTTNASAANSKARLLSLLLLLLLLDFFKVADILQRYGRISISKLEEYFF